MPGTRRDFLKTALAASAISARPEVARKLPLNPSQKPKDANNHNVSPPPRERLLMDFGWRFHLGHACDPAKDFALGSPSRGGTFAKASEFVAVANLDFEYNTWRPVE